MNKAILISIRPQWVELILNGIKKDEVRKGTTIGKAINKLIEEQGVAPMLIYCTKNGALLFKEHSTNTYLAEEENKTYRPHYALNGKVVARFNATAEHIEYETCSRDISGWWKDDGKMYDYKDACLTYKEMFDYVGGGEGTVTHITKLEIFDKPKEISEFYKIGYEEEYDLASLSWDIGEGDYYSSMKYLNEEYQLTRAPQSWCYIEI